MTLKTALIISGDSRQAQQAVADLRDDVAELGNATRATTGSLGGFDAAQHGAALSAREAAAAQGALTPAAAASAKAYGGMATQLTQVFSVQNIVKQGSGLLAGVLTGALTGGIAGVAAAAGAAALSYLGWGEASHEAEDAAKSLASRVDDIGAFFDTTTGKIKNTSRALVEFAILSRQQEIKELRGKQAASLRAAAGAVRESGQSDTRFVAPTATRGARVITDPGSGAITGALNSGDLAGLRRLAAGNDRQAKLATTVLQSLASKDSNQARIDQLSTENLALATGKLAVSKERAGRATAGHTAALRQSTGAIDRATAGSEKADAVQRELASDLTTIIGRFDPAAKAAADYADELVRINRLAAAGVDHGGISPDAAARYRDAAAAARDLATVEAQRAQLKQSNPEYFGAIKGLVQFSDAADAHGAVSDAAREAADAERQLKDAARGALDAIIVGGEKASDVINNLAKSLASAALEAGIFGTGPLAALLKGGAVPAGRPAGTQGAAGGAAGDVLGKSVSKGMESGLDRIFGKGKGAGALQQAGFGAAAAGVTGGNSALGAIGGLAGGKLATEFLTKSLGSIAGPLGGIVGGVLVGALGGLLKKTKTGSATISDSTSDATIGGNSASYQKAAAGLAGSVQDIIGDIAKRLGGTAGNFGAITIGQRHDDYRVNLGGTSLKVNGGAKDFNDDQEGAILYAAQAALARGAVTGLSAAVAKALQSSDDVEKALNEALSVQDLELLMGGITGQIDKAFRDFEVTAKERVRLAQQYGFDVVAIEKRNAEDRTKLASDLAKAQVGSLQSLVDELTRGSLFEGSAIDRIAAINQGITKAQADLDAGVEGAGDTLAKLLQDRVAASKEAYGTTGNYAADRNATLDQARAAIARANAQIAASQTKTDPALATTNAALNENNDQNAQMVSDLGDIRSILSGMAATGGGGGGGGGRLNLYDVAQF